MARHVEAVGLLPVEEARRRLAGAGERPERRAEEVRVDRHEGRGGEAAGGRQLGEGDRRRAPGRGRGEHPQHRDGDDDRQARPHPRSGAQGEHEPGDEAGGPAQPHRPAAPVRSRTCRSSPRVTRVCPVATGMSLTLNISCPVQSGVAASTAAATRPHRQLRNTTRPIAATASDADQPDDDDTEVPDVVRAGRGGDVVPALHAPEHRPAVQQQHRGGCVDVGVGAVTARTRPAVVPVERVPAGVEVVAQPHHVDRLVGGDPGPEGAEHREHGGDGQDDGRDRHQDAWRRPRLTPARAAGSTPGARRAGRTAPAEAPRGPGRRRRSGAAVRRWPRPRPSRRTGR